ncbi:hypothetical protein RGCCGE502_25328 [Rhizobium grahamii CCGE 502]|uniref:Uncharacterized protein n=1 Tax=Rhizobium grahamii CCGE 502 TaxID=990285 RepID=S3HAM7_9HYPH|nr:hypothetical protein RGCCGE502_25328 [Rhizobium grahamii CCGE 502]
MMSSLLSSVASRDRKFTTSDIGVISVFNMIAFDWLRIDVPASRHADVHMRTGESVPGDVPRFDFYRPLP